MEAVLAARAVKRAPHWREFQLVDPSGQVTGGAFDLHGLAVPPEFF